MEVEVDRRGPYGFPTRRDQFFHDVPTPTDIPSDQADEAIDRYNSGWSPARIDERLAADPTTVLNRLWERGVRTRATQGDLGLEALVIRRCSTTWRYLEPNPPRDDYSDTSWQEVFRGR